MRPFLLMFAYFFNFRKTCVLSASHSPAGYWMPLIILQDCGKQTGHILCENLKQYTKNTKKWPAKGGRAKAYLKMKGHLVFHGNVSYLRLTTISPWIYKAPRIKLKTALINKRVPASRPPFLPGCFRLYPLSFYNSVRYCRES